MSMVQEKAFFSEQKTHASQYLCLVGNISSYETKVLIDSLKIKPDLLTIFSTQKKWKEQTFEEISEKLGGAVHFISDFSKGQIQPILKNATMGTKLVLIGEWKLIRGIMQLAKEIGFTNEEMIIKGLGEKEEQVFCVKCYQLNQKTEAAVISCGHCGQTLEVSHHYSRRHDAFLGFVSL